MYVQLVIWVIIGVVVLHLLMKSASRQTPEKQKCEDILSSLNEFIGDCYSPSAIAPTDLWRFYWPNRSGDEYYYNCLLPYFLKHLKSNGVDLFSWDDKSCIEPLRNVLPPLIEEFQGPFVYKDQIIFVRCRPKDFGGLPYDKASREDYIADAVFFEYDAYIISNRDFFGIIKGSLQTQIGHSI